MACFMFPARRVIVLFVLLYFVLLFCCHVSCVLVSVKRETRDTISYPGVFKDCYKVCPRIRSHRESHLTKIGICICKCSSSYRTFVTSELKCVKDRDIRNTRQSSLKFKLYENEQPDGPLEVVEFEPVTTILFQPPNLYNEVCDLDNIEQLSHVGQWISVKDVVSNYSIIEIDDDDIERRFPWLDMKYEGWMMLKLHWRVSPANFTGRIMKIIVTCENSKRRSQDMTGEMVFKVNETFTVPDNTIPSTILAPAAPTKYYLTSALSATSSVFANSATSLLQPIKLCSLKPIISSSLQPMTASLLKPMTSSSSLQTMMSSPLKTMTSSTMSHSRSSMNVLTESVIYSSTLSSMVPSSSSMVPSSSMTMVRPVKTSKSSSNGAVTGGIVAGLVVLVVVVLFIVYVFKKRKLTVIRRENKVNIEVPGVSENNNINEDEDGIYTTLNRLASQDESNYQSLILPGANQDQLVANGYNEKMGPNGNECMHADVDVVYCTIVDSQINDRKQGAKNNEAFEKDRVSSILEQHPCKIADPKPSGLNCEPTGQECVPLDYITVLPPKGELSQSDCSVYAELSEQREGENQYQSLVKRKK